MSDDNSPNQDEVLGKIAMRGEISGRHSSMYIWFLKNMREFQNILDDYAPTWQSIAEELASFGLTDRKGNPPTVDAARQTFYRARRAYQRRWGKSRGKPAPVRKEARTVEPPKLAPGEVAPGVFLAEEERPEPAPQAEPPAADVMSDIRRKLVQGREWLPGRGGSDRG